MNVNTKKERIIRELFQLIIIFTGTIAMAAAVVVYFNSQGIAPGGVSGIGIIFNTLFSIPIWLTNLVVNIPLFVAAFKLLDKKSIIKTLYASVLFTTMLGVIPEKNLLTGDLFIDCLIGAVLMGGGLGMIFLAGASSGGTDLLATILNKSFSYISIPRIMGIVDGVIVVAGAGIFGLKNGICSFIVVYMISLVSDRVISGVGRVKVMYVISEREKAVIAYIMEDVHRGATYLNTRGCYTGVSRNMIMCVVSSKEMVKIKRKIYEIDENAICFIGDFREAFGEGFTKFIG